MSSFRIVLGVFALSPLHAIRTRFRHDRPTKCSLSPAMSPRNVGLSVAPKYQRSVGVGCWSGKGRAAARCGTADRVREPRRSDGVWDRDSPMRAVLS